MLACLSLQAQEVDEECQLDFQRLRAYHFQRFRLKILHAIAEGVNRRLSGRQELPRQGLQVGPRAAVWAPFQVSLPPLSESPPSQDQDPLFPRYKHHDACSKYCKGRVDPDPEREEFVSISR